MNPAQFDRLWTAVIPDTPLGALWVATSEVGLVAVEFGKGDVDFVQEIAARYRVPVGVDETRTGEAIKQIAAYLEGVRRDFELQIDWRVLSAFQEKTLRAVYAIPYGETRSYGKIAAQIGVPRAPRAVGRANATNPMPLVIPCHRVVGADGGLRGYGAGKGVKTKAWLLALEAANAGKDLP